MKGSYRGIIRGTILATVWENRGKHTTSQSKQLFSETEVVMIRRY
jgi:hypothetical protein